MVTSRIKTSGCFRLIDYCTNVSPGFLKEIVYFAKPVTKTSSTTICPYILDIEIFLLPLTLTGNTRIASGLGLRPKINYYCDTCQIVSFYKESYSETVLPGEFFAEKISTLKKGGIPSLLKQIHSHTCALIRVCVHFTVRDTLT